MGQKGQKSSFWLRGSVTERIGDTRRPAAGGPNLDDLDLLTGFERLEDLVEFALAEAHVLARQISDGDASGPDEDGGQDRFCVPRERGCPEGLDDLQRARLPAFPHLFSGCEQLWSDHSWAAVGSFIDGQEGSGLAAVLRTVSERRFSAGPAASRRE